MLRVPSALTDANVRAGGFSFAMPAMWMTASQPPAAPRSDRASAMLPEKGSTRFHCFVFGVPRQQTNSLRAPETLRNHARSNHSRATCNEDSHGR